MKVNRFVGAKHDRIKFLFLTIESGQARVPTELHLQENRCKML